MGTDLADRVFTATGLIPRTTYTFNVMAVNSEGEVGPSATILANTEAPVITETPVITDTPVITETPAMAEGKQGVLQYHTLCHTHADSTQFLGQMNSSNAVMHVTGW